ncbi:hypothetical protein ACERK3_01890 [Phycisphaerales bacterium AB-hyl4]|uniref:Pilus assembly protein CpaB n=1 Tax=Natronomicrosphaera hydrolytica TaxID=3242702 RepID=A0ABV4U0G9_9BACT
MPASPLVESPRRQRQLVAVLMFLVFMGSIGAAYLFSEARIGQQQVRFRTEQIDRLRFQVPEHWQTDEQAQQALGIAGARVLRNPDRPHQMLRILPIELETPQAPENMLNYATVALLGEQEIQTFQSLYVQVPSPGSALQVADRTGISRPDPSRPEVRVHLIAAMTVDQRTHWIMHLVDEPQAGEPPGRVLQQNAILFRHIERFVEVPNGHENDENDADDDEIAPSAEPDEPADGTEPTAESPEPSD